MNETITKKITVNNVEMKSGVSKKNNEKWVNWVITDEEGDRYTDWEMVSPENVGNVIEITYQETQGGPKKMGGFFTNKTIVHKPASQETVRKFQEGAARTKTLTPPQDHPFGGDKRPDAIDTTELDNAYALERLGIAPMNIGETLARLEKKVDAILNLISPPEL